MAGRDHVNMAFHHVNIAADVSMTNTHVNLPDHVSIAERCYSMGSPALQILTPPGPCRSRPGPRPFHHGRGRVITVGRFITEKPVTSTRPK
eukprot:407139-Prymnesium_polylepis.1